MIPPEWRKGESQRFVLDPMWKNQPDIIVRPPEWWFRYERENQTWWRRLTTGKAAE